MRMTEGTAPIQGVRQVGIRADLASGGLLPTMTGHVRSHKPDLYGEWRNGALTIQSVGVDPNGSDAFIVNAAFSGGSVQGVATSGLLRECTYFRHSNPEPSGGSPAM